MLISYKLLEYEKLFILEFNEQQKETLSYFYENFQFTNDNLNESYCCLIHNENILNLKNNHQKTAQFNTKQQTQQQRPKITILQLLQLSYSNEFLDFICKCLQLNLNRRIPLKNLQSHPFFQKKFNSQISISELIRIEHRQFVDIKNSQSFKHLERVAQAIQVVLPNSEKWFMQLPNRNQNQVVHFNKNSEIIFQLARELGIDPNLIYQSIEGSLSQISFIEKCRKQQTYSSNTIY